MFTLACKAFATLFMGIHKEHTVAWEKFGMKNFRQKPGATKQKHKKFSYHK